MSTDDDRNLSTGWSVDPETPDAGIVISHRVGAKVTQLLISKTEAVQLRRDLRRLLSEIGRW